MFDFDPADDQSPTERVASATTDSDNEEVEGENIGVSARPAADTADRTPPEPAEVDDREVVEEPAAEPQVPASWGDSPEPGAAFARQEPAEAATKPVSPAGDSPPAEVAGEEDNYAVSRPITEPSSGANAAEDESMDLTAPVSPYDRRAAQPEADRPAEPRFDDRNRGDSNRFGSAPEAEQAAATMGRDNAARARRPSEPLTTDTPHAVNDWSRYLPDSSPAQPGSPSAGPVGYANRARPAAAPGASATPGSRFDPQTPRVARGPAGYGNPPSYGNQVPGRGVDAFQNTPATPIPGRSNGTDFGGTGANSIPPAGSAPPAYPPGGRSGGPGATGMFPSNNALPSHPGQRGAAGAANLPPRTSGAAAMPATPPPATATNGFGFGGPAPGTVQGPAPGAAFSPYDQPQR